MLLRHRVCILEWMYWRDVSSIPHGSATAGHRCFQGKFSRERVIRKPTRIGSSKERPACGENERSGEFHDGEFRDAVEGEEKVMGTKKG